MEARVFLAALLALSAAACADHQPSATDPGTGTRGEPAPLYLAAAGHGVAGRYIVVLQDNSDPARLARAAGVSPRHVYQNSVRGFSGMLTPGQVEAVRIPLFEEKYVVCISSQVGCGLACDFCMTGKMGFRRNLSTWEMVDQVQRVRAEADRV